VSYSWNLPHTNILTEIPILILKGELFCNLPHTNILTEVPILILKGELIF
jgi:hypothetical protein